MTYSTMEELLDMINNIAAYLQMSGFKVKNVKTLGFPTHFVASNNKYSIRINDTNIEITPSINRIPYNIPLDIKELNKLIL